MNRANFFALTEVTGFVDWAAEYLLTVQVNLNISQRGTGCARGGCGPGVHGSFCGIDDIVRAYQWKAEWSDPKGGSVISQDWSTTKASLTRLSNWIQTTVASHSDPKVKQACNEIIAWGGGRKRAVGASAFLGALSHLSVYISRVGGDLSLAKATVGISSHVLEMNAMLTKVQSHYATDGLPIYDSRVAAATACLVEIYRQSLPTPWKSIPSALLFKAADRASRRRVIGLDVKRLGFSAPVIDPGVIDRSTKHSGTVRRARDWSSAKIRLGWLLEEILVRADKRGSPLLGENTPFNHLMPAKMHALEAGLFMVGFDVSCF